MAANDFTNIQIYRRKRGTNIGIILFGIIFVYLIVTILAYVTSNHISVYEVREGSILKDTAYTGIVLRQEEIITADADGYINYFVTEGSKVGHQTNVYSISDEKLDLGDFGGSGDAQAEGGGELTAEEQSAIVQKAQSFSESYRPEQYGDIYSFKDSIMDVVQTNSAQSRQSKLDALLQDGAQNLSVYPAKDDGIIIYSTDGYEDLTLDQVTEDMIAKTDYENTEFTDNASVHAGDPVYKLITSDEWTLVIELDDELAQELAETTSMKIRFSKDNVTTWANFSIYNTKDSNLGFFTLDHSMIRYATDRFLDIELILEDESGLKIPKSSVTKKDFYAVPQDYLTSGGNSSETGVLVQGKKTVEFEPVTVYGRDAETDMAYIDANAFDQGTKLVKPDSEDTYTLSETNSLSGVYNVNKGYAIFRQVDILCESDEYYIISSGSDYGLSNYDHIALDSSSVHENDIVF